MTNGLTCLQNVNVNAKKFAYFKLNQASLFLNLQKRNMVKINYFAVGKYIFFMGGGSKNRHKTCRILNFFETFHLQGIFFQKLRKEFKRVLKVDFLLKMYILIPTLIIILFLEISQPPTRSLCIKT